jgi:hypothetical protein
MKQSFWESSTITSSGKMSRKKKSKSFSMGLISMRYIESRVLSNEER